MSLRKSISRFFGLPDQGRDSNVADEDKSNGNSKETKPAYYFGAINFAARRYAAGEARDYTRKMELLHKAIVKQANELALPDFVAKYFPPQYVTFSLRFLASCNLLFFGSRDYHFIFGSAYHVT